MLGTYRIYCSIQGSLDKLHQAWQDLAFSAVESNNRFSQDINGVSRKILSTTTWMFEVFLTFWIERTDMIALKYKQQL
jgi:hypothetical protein